MNFSAKQVINTSSAKLRWLREHPYEKNQNEDRYAHLQRQGILFQENIAKVFSSEGYEEEMGGHVTNSIGDRIYFSNDIVLNDGATIIECKLPILGNSDDFLKKSILQCAFYSFLSDQCSILKKSKFAIEQGYSDSIIRLQDNFQYLLAFGKHIYKIEVTNPWMLWNYLDQKLIASAESYEAAKEFDITHPKEYIFEMLSSAFTVTQIL